VPLKKGVMNASDGELESGERFCEELAVWSTVLVFLGLVLEVYLAFKPPPPHSCLERWGAVAADTLVAIGVLGELLFSMLSRSYQKELQRRSNDKLSDAIRRAGEATERAVAAELATETLRAQFAWRRLSANAIDLMSKLLQGVERRELQITYFGSDPEATTFAHDLGAVFSKCGWAVKYESAAYTGNVVFGIVVPKSTFADWKRVELVRVAMADAGIDVSGDDNMPQPFMRNPEPGHALSISCLQMYVGPKPMPALD
jgi:hypothetical protein